MQILSLRLKNIKSHREAEFHFSPGINVLAGPNGAGKSTVFEAIGYGLFGVDARDIVGRADRFLTLGAKRGEVEVVFRDDAGEVWRVTRTVGANARWLLAQQRGESFETEEHARAEETEERLRQILGLDRTRPLAEQFRQVIGPLQSDFLGPFVLRGGKRQEAFDRILGIDGWRRTFEGTLELQKGVAHRIACLQAEIAGRSEQLSLLPERRSELRATRQQQREKEKELGGVEKELAAVQSRLTGLEQQARALEAAQGEVRLLHERIGKGGAMVEEAQRRLADAQAAGAIVEATAPARHAFEQAEARVKELRLQERQLQQEERGVREQEKRRDRLAQQLQHEEAEIAAADRQLAAEEAAILARLAEAAAPAVVALAERLPELRRALDQRRRELALVPGRRESLREGQGHLAAGNCPFLGESCGNLAAAGAPFDDRLTDLDRLLADRQQEVEKL
ncbi:MAG: SMC family ATPase, partial [Desulfuromonadales bacterium]|nr:SMC family ATPase [Desulfuromonadales bacterium]